MPSALPSVGVRLLDYVHQESLDLVQQRVKSLATYARSVQIAESLDGLPFVYVRKKLRELFRTNVDTQLAAAVPGVWLRVHQEPGAVGRRGLPWHILARDTRRNYRWFQREAASFPKEEHKWN